ncbi:ketopantoate reductase family protein [Actinomadura nitritigenes]|uniref:ketopantoate reductase family protein n=1 Tax=Actinomadura nitritigenes TaxID=134602 RepID=UPI003D950713
MRVTIVGGGAMGGTLAVEAASAGHEVSVVDVDRDLRAHAAASGLSADTPEGPLHASVPVVPEPDGGADVALVFVKAQHTAAVAKAVEPLAAAGTIVASLQNGWGNADVLAETVPQEQLVVGVTYNSCTRLSTGHTAHTGRGPTFVGPYRSGAPSGPSDTVAGLLSSSGWTCEATAAVLGEIWKKLVLNAATLPTAALTGLPAGVLCEPAAMRPLVDGLAAEAVAVARAQRLDLDLDERLEAIHRTLGRAGRGRASMLQDADARRKTEIETVNGAVVRASERHGVDAPLNRAMVALVAGLERSWSL